MAMLRQRLRLPIDADLSATKWMGISHTAPTIIDHKYLTVPVEVLCIRRPNVIHTIRRFLIRLKPISMVLRMQICCSLLLGLVLFQAIMGTTVDLIV
jgi:hypothetical protein